MDKRWATITIIVLIMVFAAYIVVDSALKKTLKKTEISSDTYDTLSPAWNVIKTFKPSIGSLYAIAVSEDSLIIAGGETGIICYDNDFRMRWEINTKKPVSALASSVGNVYAATGTYIMVYDINGKKVDDWGPYEENALITSVASCTSYIAFADAANKALYVLDKDGIIKSIIGKSDKTFNIPSGYFDVALTGDNFIYVANTGYKKIEKRDINGKLLSSFGDSGSEPENFCGCCNPAHFAIIPGGFITAEKGINRIKKIDDSGKFVELISSANEFPASVPLDIAVLNNNLIFAANPSDSKIYVFERKK